MTQHKDPADELADRIAEADRIASEGISLYRQGDRLHATIRDGDDVAEAMEKALAEHIAAHRRVPSGCRKSVVRRGEKGRAIYAMAPRFGFTAAREA